MNQGVSQIPEKFWEFYGKKAFTADVQAESLTQLKTENEQLKKALEKNAKSRY